MQQQNATPFQSPSSQGLSEPFDNPFDAIRAIATRQDLEIIRSVLMKVPDWKEFNSLTFLDDILQEIAGATNIVIEYELGILPRKYRACYDGGRPINRPDALQLWSETAIAQGWNVDSKLSIAMGFLLQHGLIQAFAYHAAKCAQDENQMGF